jgi:ubiquinone biosynthesis monooxygenase Coq7
MEPDRLIDPFIVSVDRALRAVFAPARASRPVPVAPWAPKSTDLARGGGIPPSPGPSADTKLTGSPDAPVSTPPGTSLVAAPVRPPGPAPLPELSETERREAAALMRVNHAGEVAAQALYHGQAALARNPATREMLLRAAREEADHLGWCQQRLQELDSRPSVFGPLWYAGSFAIGALAAALGDRISLGFVAETERQVEGHIDSHLERLPAADTRSRAILEAMRHDEIEHGEAAISAGGAELPAPARELMRGTARVMTFTSYWV